MKKLAEAFLLRTKKILISLHFLSLGEENGICWDNYGGFFCSSNFRPDILFFFFFFCMVGSKYHFLLAHYVGVFLVREEGLVEVERLRGN